MTRREKRFFRRKQKRIQKKMIVLSECGTLEKTASLKSLYYAAKKAAKGVSWKYAVQIYMANIFFNIIKAKKNILEEKEIKDKPFVFKICDRGKLRIITSIPFTQRVQQAALSRTTLVPVICKSLVTDNYACQKNKGTHFAIKRITKKLVRFSKKYGNKGYALSIDFKSYFDSIQHEKVRAMLEKYFNDSRVIDLTIRFIKASVSSDTGLGLGSEVSQTIAVAFINSIDHYAVEIFRNPYGRYNDDTVILSNNKEELKIILNKLKELYSALNLKLNDKKTHITKLKDGFKFLKVRFSITNSGKILKKPCRQCITKARRRLKKHKKLLDKGVLDMNTIEQSFNSWKGSMRHKHARKTIYKMDMLYNELFKGGKNHDNK